MVGLQARGTREFNLVKPVRWYGLGDAAAPQRYRHADARQCPRGHRSLRSIVA